MTAMVALASKATLLVMGGWATASVLRQRSAAERHVVWVAFFCGLLLLPILERRGPVVATLAVLPAETAPVVELAADVGEPAVPGGRAGCHGAGDRAGYLAPGDHPERARRALRLSVAAGREVRD